jgi:hypothetical protein
MIIKYRDGREVEGFLLLRHDSSMRVAVEGGEDVAEFIEMRGNWVSDSLEPVEITFEWQRTKPAPVQSEADFICSKELADHLIQLLETDSDKQERPKHFTAGRSFI